MPAKNAKKPHPEGQNLGIYRKVNGTSIEGGLNRMATPWTADVRPVVSAYGPKYKVFINDVGDGTAASRKRGKGLRPSDPMGYCPYGRNR